MRPDRPGVGRRRGAAGGRGLRPQLRGGQDQRLGAGPGGQQRRPCVSPWSTTARSRLSALFVHRRLQARGSPGLRRGRALGDNHGVWPFLRTYSICKIAAEGTARWGAGRFALPTTIARLSVPYGDTGGWPAIHLHMMVSGHAVPVHVDSPSVYHRCTPTTSSPWCRSLAAAGVPAVTVNWGGSEPVSIEEWCTYLAGPGRRRGSVRADRAHHRQRADRHDAHARLGGPTTVHWRDGMRRMARALQSDTRVVTTVRFEVCDPEEPPASGLLAAMRAELNDVYETFNRLDNPPLTAAELRAPGGRVCGRLRGRRRGGRGRGSAYATRTWRRSSACTSGPRRDRRASQPRSLPRSRTPPARSVTLATPRHRAEAGARLRLYRTAGYVEVPPYNDNPFACFWGEKGLA